MSPILINDFAQHNNNSNKSDNRRYEMLQITIMPDYRISPRKL